MTNLCISEIFNFYSRLINTVHRCVVWPQWHLK